MSYIKRKKMEELANQAKSEDSINLLEDQVRAPDIEEEEHGHQVTVATPMGNHHDSQGNLGSLHQTQSHGEEDQDSTSRPRSPDSPSAPPLGSPDDDPHGRKRSKFMSRVKTALHMEEEGPTRVNRGNMGRRMSWSGALLGAKSSPLDDVGWETKLFLEQIVKLNNEGALDEGSSRKEDGSRQLREVVTLQSLGMEQAQMKKELASMNRKLDETMSLLQRLTRRGNLEPLSPLGHASGAESAKEEMKVAGMVE